MSSFTRLQQFLTTLAAIGLTLALGWIDGEIGADVGLGLLYVFPIAAVSWVIGSRAGLGVAALSGLLAINAQSAGWASYAQPWVPAWNTLSVLILFTAVAIATARVQALLKNEARLAREDVLTHVPNLLSFNEQLPVALNAVGQRSPLTLGLVSLHGIDYVNERFGTAAGDLLIRVTADTLIENLRPSDRLGRIVGTTFAVVLPGTGEETASQMLGVARDQVLGKLNLYGRPVSVAIAAVSTDQRSIAGESLLDQTHWLLQTIKQEGTHHPISVVTAGNLHRA
jgi:diguanylate cyclase (GGDEF)-like protein